MAIIIGHMDPEQLKKVLAKKDEERKRAERRRRPRKAESEYKPADAKEPAKTEEPPGEAKSEPVKEEPAAHPVLKQEQVNTVATQRMALRKKPPREANKAEKGLCKGEREEIPLATYEREQRERREAMERIVRDPNRSEEERRGAQVVADHLREMDF